MKNYFKNLPFNSNQILTFLKKKNIKKKKIGGYYPYNYEVDILNVLKKLEKENYSISLPKVRKNNTMNFYKWSFKDPLSINLFGIAEPITKKKIYPDILLIPLVAFDDQLNRLGYGGGFYDRYISEAEHNKKIIKIGIGFSFQRVRNLPTNRYDKKLDFVITEKDFI